MDITEKAKQYAQGKALDAINAAIEQAYKDGYNDGLQHLENEELEAAKTGIKFKDLDLPNRNSWSNDYVKFLNVNMVNYMPYKEAAKLDIPTKKDFEEFVSNCVINYINETRFHGLKFTGNNGAEIKLHYECYENQYDKGQNCVIFWLKGEEEDNERSYACIYSPDKWEVLKTFMGYKLPVMLVRKEQ